MNLRLITADFIASILKKERSLLTLDKALPNDINPSQRAYIKNLCYQFFRYYYRIEHHIEPLLQRKPKPYAKLLLMLTVLEHKCLKHPIHAIVDAYVEIAKCRLNQHQANFINATSRKLVSQDFNDDMTLELPQWLVGKLRKAYPEQWQDILYASNKQAPLFIRVNTQYSTNEILTQLSNENFVYRATTLPQCFELVDAPAIHTHPLFISGKISIQDLSPQYAAEIVSPQAHETILDACAAPGGKTAHLLEKCPNIAQLDAFDIHPKRLSMVEETLQRLKLADTSVALKCQDITQPMQGLYDKILLDAPCSATGVIRRNPDIKVLRQPDDVVEIVRVQAQALDNLWQNLRPSGLMLYATCSILPEENDKQMARFLERQPDASVLEIPLLSQYKREHGYQILPKEGDGFYYCLLRKRSQTRNNPTL